MAFKTVFQTLSTLGQNLGHLVDCTEVVRVVPLPLNRVLKELGIDLQLTLWQVPVPPPPQGSPHFPAGAGMNLVEQACAQSLFPTLPTNPGPPTSVAPVPFL
ncbi:hypothetical protein C8Q73DRAFT_35015 [Cubamyces lactineus]|nr:hypothetical protein C8Q73DRAFT_35015 [Cubamyces lactineus]